MQVDFPHYICPFLSLRYSLWTSIADVLISSAYLVLSILILRVGFALHKTVGKLPFDRVGYAFSTFIFLCGTTHFDKVIGLWFPYWNFYLIISILTAIISIWTARLLWNSKEGIVSFISGRINV